MNCTNTPFHPKILQCKRVLQNTTHFWNLWYKLNNISIPLSTMIDVIRKMCGRKLCVYVCLLSLRANMFLWNLLHTALCGYSEVLRFLMGDGVPICQSWIIISYFILVIWRVFYVYIGEVPQHWSALVHKSALVVVVGTLRYIMYLLSGTIYGLYYFVDTTLNLFLWTLNNFG